MSRGGIAVAIVGNARHRSLEAWKEARFVTLAALAVSQT
jgi:hypothetical protein